MEADRQPRARPPDRAIDGVMDQLPIGLMTMDLDGRVVAENEVLRALWGSLERGTPTSVFPADAYSADGRLLGEHDWPIWRSVSAGETIDEALIELERPDGEPISIVTSSRPIVKGGRLAGGVMVVRDVSRERDRLELREAFVGVLSHELRTPITSIYSGVELLRAHRLDEAVAQDVLRDVAVEAESLHRLVEDLLMMVRLERGATIASLEPVLLQHVVPRAIEDERRRWPERDFRAELPADLRVVDADPGLLRQVLRNLLSNAAKYGRGRVTVTATDDGARGELLLHVVDDGPGVPVVDRDRVFDLLYRGTDGLGIPGAGIGLYVARALMEAMGGSVHNVPRTGGAEFVAAFPISRESATDGPPRPTILPSARLA